VTVAVVGAGIAGLAAAWELARSAVDVLVLDAERRPGGVIVTERRDGFVVEGGPDGFLAAEPDIQDLARELGVGDRLVDQQVQGSSLWTGKRLKPLAEGRAAELLGIQAPAEADLSRGFRSFASGMAEIVEALVAKLGNGGPRIRRTHGVTGLAPATRGWRLSITGGSSLDVEAVVLAVPVWVTSRLLASVGVEAARSLGDVVYHPSITVSLAYRADQVPAGLEGAGFVSAVEAEGSVRACTFAWRKYPGRAPNGFALLRAFLGATDGDPGAVAHAELGRIIGLRGEPLWTRAFEWPRGLPRYHRGHVERVADVRHRLARLAPLAIAGAGLDGAGVSACVKSGRAAARAILGRLGSP
jgi:oxygen-dependent protoporphyrinogen oxidase